MPVFNAEPYLNESVSSILNQSFKDLELICINDGSTDNSVNVLKNFSKKDNRVRILSQNNLGAGAARNKGIDNSNGEYIYFMDADDILELNAFEILYTITNEYPIDMIIFKLINFNNKSGKKFKKDYYEMKFLQKKYANKVFAYRDIGKNLFSIAVSPPGKFFKRTLIGSIRFPEGVIYEDNVFFFKVLFNSKKIYFLNQYLYNRRIRDNSVSSNKSPNYADSIICLNSIIDLAKSNNLFHSIFKKELYNRKINLLYYRLNYVDKQYKLDFFKKIKNDLINKKQEYESDPEFFPMLNSRNLNIYNSFLEYDSYMEFDLDILFFDSKICKSDTDYPKISFIKEVENDFQNIKKYLLNIMNQPYKNIEIIFIDSDSDDELFTIIDNLSKKYAFIKTYYNKESFSKDYDSECILINSKEYLLIHDLDSSNEFNMCIDQFIINNQKSVNYKGFRYLKENDNSKKDTFLIKIKKLFN